MVAFRNVFAERRCEVKQRVPEFTRTRIHCIAKEGRKLGTSVIPPLPNLAKKAIRVQYFNFGARHLVWGITTGLGIGTGNDALSQNSLIFPLGVWQQVPGQVLT